MSSTLDMVHGLGFDDGDIARCRMRKGLLSIELEFTKRCNLRCLYCYSSAGAALENEMAPDEIRSVILQAKELGAKKIILLGGGEPLIYQGFVETVRYIRSLGLQQVLFTNGTLITMELARLLFEYGVSVVIKHNSMEPAIQDMLAGVPGTCKGIRRGLEHLMAAGYPGRNRMLGIQTVICRHNIRELPAMWTWARERRIVPYFEIMTHQGRAKENDHLTVSVDEVKAVFDRLEAIDQEHFGVAWKSRPTIAAFSCKRHLYSCLINSQGYVQPCTGIDMPVGNVRERPLRDILATSPVIGNLRNIYEMIEGACRSCEYNCECYGCRGNAYQMTGNYLASDPTCWRFKKALNEGPARFCQQ